MIRKNWISKKDFPFRTFPPYKIGPLYAMTMDLAGELFETSKYVPWIPLEDVYITGILGKIAKVKLLDFTDMNTFYQIYGSITYCDVILETTLLRMDVSPKKLYEIWKSLKVMTPDDVKRCKFPRFKNP